MRHILVGENKNYYQIRNAYLQSQSVLKKNGGHFEDGKTGTIRLVTSEFAHFFKEASIMTTGGSEKEKRICWTCFYYYAGFNK